MRGRSVSRIRIEPSVSRVESSVTSRSASSVPETSVSGFGFAEPNSEFVGPRSESPASNSKSYLTEFEDKPKQPEIKPEKMSGVPAFENTNKVLTHSPSEPHPIRAGLRGASVKPMHQGGIVMVLPPTKYDFHPTETLAEKNLLLLWRRKWLLLFVLLLPILVSVFFTALFSVRIDVTNYSGEISSTHTDSTTLQVVSELIVSDEKLASRQMGLLTDSRTLPIQNKVPRAPITLAPAVGPILSLSFLPIILMISSGMASDRRHGRAKWLLRTSVTLRSVRRSWLIPFVIITWILVVIPSGVLFTTIANISALRLFVLLLFYVASLASFTSFLVVCGKGGSHTLALIAFAHTVGCVPLLFPTSPNFQAFFWFLPSVPFGGGLTTVIQQEYLKNDSRHEIKAMFVVWIAALIAQWLGYAVLASYADSVLTAHRHPLWWFIGITRKIPKPPETFTSDTIAEDVPNASYGLRFRDVHARGGKANGGGRLRGLTLDAMTNRTIVFLGGARSGKTALLEVVGGAQEHLISGKAIVNGTNVAKDPDAITFEVGYCPQENDALWPYVTTHEHLVRFARLNGFAVDADKVVELIMQLFALEEVAKRPVNKLTRSEKRALCVALAFSGGSRLVLLDEPTRGCDAWWRRIIWRAIKRLGEGRTILYTTSLVEDAEVMPHQLVVLHKGQAFATGSLRFVSWHLQAGYLLTCLLNHYHTQETIDKLKHFISSQTQSKVVLEEASGNSVQIRFSTSRAKQLGELLRLLKQVSGEIGILQATLTVRNLNEQLARIESGIRPVRIDQFPESPERLDEVAKARKKRHKELCAMNEVVCLDTVWEQRQQPSSGRSWMLTIISLHTSRLFSFRSVLSFAIPILLTLLACLLATLLDPSTSQYADWLYSKGLEEGETSSPRQVALSLAAVSLTLPLGLVMILVARLRPLQPLLIRAVASSRVQWFLVVISFLPPLVISFWISALCVGISYAASSKASTEGISALQILRFIFVPTLAALAGGSCALLWGSLHKIERYQQCHSYLSLVFGALTITLSLLLVAWPLSLGNTTLQYPNMGGTSFISNSPEEKTAKAFSLMAWYLGQFWPIFAVASTFSGRSDYGTGAMAACAMIGEFVVAMQLLFMFVAERRKGNRGSVRLIPRSGRMPVDVEKEVEKVKSCERPDEVVRMVDITNDYDLQYSHVAGYGGPKLWFEKLVSTFKNDIEYIPDFMNGVVRAPMCPKEFFLGVRKGEIMTIMGTPHAGKSTIHALLTGELVPSVGHVSLYPSRWSREGGANLNTSAPSHKAVGSSSQSPVLHSELSPRGHLNMYGKLRNVPNPSLLTEELLGIFHLLKVGNRPCYKLSASKKRLLSLALALVGAPPLLFLDTPFDSLSRSERARVGQILKAARAYTDAIVITSSDIESCRRIADKMVLLDGGRAYAVGTPEELEEKFDGKLRLFVRLRNHRDMAALVQDIEANVLPKGPETRPRILYDQVRIDIPLVENLADLFFNIDSVLVNFEYRHLYLCWTTLTETFHDTCHIRAGE